MSQPEFRFGVASFDQPDVLEDGWAAIDGERAQRIRSLGDLDSDTYWLLNVNYATWTRHALHHRNRLKRADYLRTVFVALEKELGLEEHMMERSSAVELMAEVFGRVMRLAITKYGVGATGQLRARYLSDEIYWEIVQQEDRSINPQIDLACKLAHQVRVDCTAAWPPGATGVRFLRSRIPHALNVLSTPIPSSFGPWELITNDRLPPQRSRNEFLLSLNQPLLVRASYSRVAPEYAPLLAGSGSYSNARGWMSHPEFVFMQKYSNVRVECAYVGTRYQHLQLKQPLYIGDELGPLSISAGLLMESTLASLIFERPFKPGAPTGFIGPRAAWLAADERFRCLNAAALMRAMGFTVMSYGHGSVLVAVQREDYDYALRCAKAFDLLPPVAHPLDSRLRRAA